MNKYSLSALLAAGLLAGNLATGAQAADLGGDCCADLEERVAELEATTARKGNRKVSLTVSGFVAQQVLAWDDGVESNVYITDTGSVSIGTHFAFSGKAQINSEWDAGFLLKIEAMNNDSLGVNQDTDEGGNVFAAVQGNPGSVMALESAYWYLRSNRLGRLSVGQQSSAADNQAILPDGSGSLVQANYVMYDVQGFTTLVGGNRTGFNWGALANCHPVGGAVAADCDGYPSNVVRYDSPTIAGFSASTSWGEDDVWAVSGRYAGEFSGVKLAGAIAYVQSSDEGAPGATGANAGALANGGLDVGHLQIGAYAEHVQSGLFVYGAYGTEDNEVTASSRGAGRLNPDGENWYIKAGLKRQVFAIGSTTFYGEYGNNDDKMTAGLFDAGVTDSELEQYGIGIVQNVDAAAMQLWVAWRHYEGDLTCDSALAGATGCAGVGLAEGNSDLDEFDLVKFGALINF
ncbi:MAG: porin [Alphaproteobacteria bacterium]|nr:porin [Alphaproteobacteria bacterium]